MENPFANPLYLPLSQGGLTVNREGPLVKGGNEGGFETRRSDLSPIVRSYADRLYARIQDIYKKYGVSSVAELNAKVASGQKPKNLKPGELKSDTEELAKLQGKLESALENNVVPEGEPEMEGFVVLRDVPKFPYGLPSVSALMDKEIGYKFDFIWGREYREGRPASDFSLTEKDLSDMKFDDPQKRQELLSEMAEAKENKGPERLAKVFDISETIAEKKKENPDHADWLTTKEVLEAMDQAGCRPATLEELLAFGKEFWKPDADPKTLMDEEKSLRRVSAQYIYALGSPFVNSGGRRHVPCLNWHEAKRLLNGSDLGVVWQGVNRFLVVRKLSSSFK